MNKIIGYIIAIAGLCVLAIGLVNEARTFVQTSLKLNLSQINDISLIIVGIIVVAVGIFIVLKSRSSGSRRKGAEVPIYQGKNIVGYRRH